MGRILLAGAILASWPLFAQQAEPPKDGAEFFEKKILPVLEQRCYKCHSAKAEKLKGGLHLDSREGMLHGGDTGPSLVPGDPEKSLIIKAVRFTDDELQMPPKQKLPAAQIADFETWVKMGAPDPRKKLELPKPDAARLWSLQPPQKAAVPDGVYPIDHFIGKKLAEKNLKASPTADKRTLIRRATYDLTGLPPTPDEIDAFLADDSPDAFAKVVDRLLASPRYGECWGRHWLDVARYADTKEWVVDEERRLPYAYTYRDWVIRALNEDLPYDQFVLQQLAADRLPTASDVRSLAALGYITVGRTFLNRMPDIIDDRIDVVTRGFMGLTAQCARCHDHKYDPIPTKDYYSLYGVFANARPPQELPLIETPARTAGYADFEKELKAKEGEVTKFKELKHAEILKGFRTPARIAEYLLAANDAKSLPPEDLRGFAQKRSLTNAMLGRWVAFTKKTLSGPDPVFAPWNALAALPAKEFAELAPAALAALADVNPIVQNVLAEPPRSLQETAEIYGQLLARYDQTAACSDPREEELRQALCGPNAAANMPLTEVEQFFTGDDKGKMKKLKRALDELHNHPNAPARAMALEDLTTLTNARVFIRGSSTAPGEEVPRRFLSCLSGKEFTQGSGRLELAQAIASRDNPLTARVFVNRVWMHHFGLGIVRTPSDFGTRGERPTHPELLDWLAVWFMDNGWSTKKLHRLIMLSSAYRQSSQPNPEAQRADPLNLCFWRMNRTRLEFEELRDSLMVVTGDIDWTMGGRPVQLTTEPFSRRRTVYGYIDRLNLANVFRVFDFAVPDMHAPMRYTTTVPQQALFMLNSPFVQDQAIRLARRPDIAAETDPEQRVQRLYRRIYGRAATAKEVILGLEFVQTAHSDSASRIPPWQYGYGAKEFQPLAHYTGTAWQGGPKLPDPKSGWCTLTSMGGHAGAEPVLRRWTAPRDGTVTISGIVSHKEKTGDGVRARIVSSSHGELAAWTVCRMEAETKIAGITVKRGDTIDFAVECRAEPNSDAFLWAPVIHMGEEEWSSYAGFGLIEKLPEPMTPWERYAQVLLDANEFTFVD